MKHKKILLVEDNPDDEELTILALSERKIMPEVVTVHDGLEAIEYLFNPPELEAQGRSYLPQLILLDLKLPKLSGFDLLEKLRADPRTEMIPVVVLTSSSEEGDIIKSYKLGANSYVRKPVEYQRFAEAVRQVGDYWLLLNEPPPN